MRDVEATLQEALLTQFHDLFITRAAAAASAKSATSDGAARDLAPLLVALAGDTCLG